MTSICVAGGPSNFKNQFAPIVYVGPAALGALIGNIPTSWAVPLAAFLGTLTYDLSTFCTVDPPADPGITAADVILFLQLENPLQHLAALRIQQLFDRYAWYQFCECTSGATPSAPTFPTAPTGLPQINPPLTGFPIANATPCVTFSQSEQHTAGQRFSGGGPDGSGRNITLTRITATNHTISGAGCSSTIEIDKEYPFTPVTPVVIARVGVPINTTRVFYVPFDPLQPVAWSFAEGTTGTGLGQVDYTIDMFCDGAGPGETVSPCCPPDPELAGTLARILSTVTLIQRQSAPFAYVYGSNHTALSGHGSFAVSGLIGVSVDVTTIPAWGGRIDGSPVEYFDLGFVTLGTSDGYEVSRRIDHDGTLVLPPSAGAFTAVGFTLEPGVVVSIRELVREP